MTAQFNKLVALKEISLVVFPTRTAKPAFLGKDKKRLMLPMFPNPETAI